MGCHTQQDGLSVSLTRVNPHKASGFSSLREYEWRGGRNGEILVTRSRVDNYDGNKKKGLIGIRKRRDIERNRWQYPDVLSVTCTICGSISGGLRNKSIVSFNFKVIMFIMSASDA